MRFAGWGKGFFPHKEDRHNVVFKIKDGFVGGQIPVINNKGLAQIGFALHDGLVHRARRRDIGASGPFSLGRGNTGGNPQQFPRKNLKNGGHCTGGFCDFIYDFGVIVQIDHGKTQRRDGHLFLLVGDLVGDGHGGGGRCIHGKEAPVADCLFKKGQIGA